MTAFIVGIVAGVVFAFSRKAGSPVPPAGGF